MTGRPFPTLHSLNSITNVMNVTYQCMDKVMFYLPGVQLASPNAERMANTSTAYPALIVNCVVNPRPVSQYWDVCIWGSAYHLRIYMFASIYRITTALYTHQMPETINTMVSKWQGHHELAGGPQHWTGGSQVGQGRYILCKSTSTDQIADGDYRHR